MSAAASIVCPICDGTGWRVVERGGLSGAARCSCVSATKWWRFRELTVKKHQVTKKGRWIYFEFQGPANEAREEAHRLTFHRNLDVECLGVNRPEQVASAPFHHRGTLSFYMEKF